MSLTTENNPNRFFTFAVKLDLANESFRFHDLKTEYLGSILVIESKGFFDYTECVSSCSNLLVALACQLSKQTNTVHQLAWEANPKLQTENRNFITPVENWNDGELVKIYITTSIAPITLKNLSSCAQASVLTGARDLSTH
jgi:hypothetical protein